ncbi:MAG: hypothetical protein IKM31_10585, partial [Oscillospiraceae bacterium]|nr:hypothetical protein [Oscillospiraceae bacterium]
MRTRLRPRLCIGLPAEKTKKPRLQKNAGTKSPPLLPCLACAGVIFLTTALVPRLPHLQEGVLLAAKLTLALPSPAETEASAAPSDEALSASLPAAERPAETPSLPAEDPLPAPEAAGLPEETAPETDQPQSYAPIP